MLHRQTNLLWRVEWFHRSGYQAPMQFVEAETRKQAIKKAKKQSRLAAFPAKWYCRVH